MMTTGEKILYLRNQKHISQEELAGSIGVSRQAISKWETDQSVPDLENLKWLAEFFQVKLSSLIEEGDILSNEGMDDSTKPNTLLRGSRYLFLTSIGLSCWYFILMILMIVFQDIFFWKNKNSGSLIFPVPTFLLNAFLCIVLIGMNLYLWRETKKESKGLVVEKVLLIIGGILSLVVQFITSIIEEKVIDGYILSQESFMVNNYITMVNMLNNIKVIYLIGNIIFIIGAVLMLAAKYISKKGYSYKHSEKPYTVGYGFLSFILGFVSLITVPLMSYWLYEMKQIDMLKYKQMRVLFLIGVCLQGVIRFLFLLFLILLKISFYS